MIACYDLQHCPPTYDIVAFLLLAEAERLRRHEKQIDIHILPGPIGGFREDGLWPYTLQGRSEMLRNVALPMCEMLPTATSVTLQQDRPDELKNQFGAGNYLISLSNILRGLQLAGRPLRPRLPVQKELSLVTMTLRESDHYPKRNSRVGEWIRAARILRVRGFRVVMVRDTLRASEYLDMDTTDVDTVNRAAATNLHDRAKLYASAFLNMGINNGPMWFAIAMDAPVLMLRPTTENAGGPFDNGFFAESGLREGAQLPKSSAHQRLAWRPDTADDIVAAFDEMVPCLT